MILCEEVRGRITDEVNGCGVCLILLVSFTNVFLLYKWKPYMNIDSYKLTPSCVWNNVFIHHDGCDGLIKQSWKSHYTNVIMSAMASQITSITIVYSTIYSGADQRKHQSFCEGNSPMTSEFPSQRASSAENVSIWWRYHEVRGCQTYPIVSCEYACLFLPAMLAQIISEDKTCLRLWTTDHHMFN